MRALCVCLQTEEQMAALPEGQRTPLEMERVWCGWTCNQALLAGEAHFSAPYFLLDGFYDGRSRISQLGTSCTTMGGPNTFFTLKPAVVTYPVRAHVHTGGGQGRSSSSSPFLSCSAVFVSTANVPAASHQKNHLNRVSTF
jgi:hypothetical protein